MIHNIKNKQKVGLKAALWSTNSSQVKNYFTLDLACKSSQHFQFLQIILNVV
jgi:hypothetical protein